MTKEQFMTQLPKSIENSKMTKQIAKELAWLYYQKGLLEKQVEENSSAIADLFNQSEQE